VPPKRRGGFTPETARAASAKALETRKKKKDLEASIAGLVQSGGHVAQAGLLELADDLSGARETLPARAIAGAQTLIDRIRAGEVSDSHVHYVAKAARDLVELARLEEGKATSNTLKLTATAGDFKEYMDRVRGEIAVVPNGTDVPEAASDALEVTARG
jgi:hypothetical protein